jgi:segregation and condensation protein B
VTTDNARPLDDPRRVRYIPGMHDTEGETTHNPRNLAAATATGMDAMTPSAPQPGAVEPTTDELIAETAVAKELTVVAGDGPPADVATDELTAAPDSEVSSTESESPTVEEEDGPVFRGEGDADADTETLEAPEGMGEQEITTERVVEAILFASDAPLPLSKIVSILGVGSARDARNHIKSLNERYAQTGAAFRIEQIASGYQMLTLPTYNTWIRRLKQTNKDNKLSQAAMETLAVVAYKQPVVRADIEAIRGVAAGEMLNRLRELGLIKIVGRAEDVGRPMLYGTTKRFLEVFGLSGLEDLPEVEQMQAGE